MKPTSLDRHPGMYDEDTGVFVFYDLVFSSIFRVVAFLKDVPPGPSYRGENIKGIKLLYDPFLDAWWSKGNWWLDKETALDVGKSS